MAEDFYPFVNNDGSSEDGALIPRHPARIAVYDDASAAPRVVEVEPKDVRAYLEEITLQVTQLAQAQGGSIPFMVIREIVENLIHAYFIEPTVSILDHGNTIRFSDQGPGIREKRRALQYGTTSATEEMRRYIRGVGSGLPYVQQYMYDKGGSLLIEDNMSGGTVVTLSAQTADMVSQQPPMSSQMAPYQQNCGPQRTVDPQAYSQDLTPAAPQSWQQGTQGWQQGGQGWQQPAQPWQTQTGWQQPGAEWRQQGWTPQQQGWPPQQGWQQPYTPQPQAPQAPYASPAQTSATSPWPAVSPRGQAVLTYLSAHESVGPSDLARVQGGSQPTWTRELQTLEDQGFVRKDGQKRRLTGMGQAYLQQLGPNR